jgi:pyruvate,orthophosphate dikinase
MSGGRMTKGKTKGRAASLRHAADDASFFLIACHDDHDPGHDPTVSDVGFKAYNLWRMARIGLPVPPAFVLGTAMCHAYNEAGRVLSPHNFSTVGRGVGALERVSGLGFGRDSRPLLLSVRSGAPVSMPGMLDTVLNVGLNDRTVRGLIRITGNPWLAWDSYRRLVDSFVDVVGGIDRAPFDELRAARLAEAGLDSVAQMDFAQLAALTRASLSLYEDLSGAPFPQDPWRQLRMATTAVFDSWQREKACEYRRINGIDDRLGTAVTVQQMVFGNAGADSGSGVGFSRDPSSGENRMMLEFLFNAQGEDVVSGARTGEDTGLLDSHMPETMQAIREAASLLEHELGDMQEFEFTVQEGKLYMLQARNGKRTAWAALRIAVDQVAERLLSAEDALERLKGIDLARVQKLRVVASDATILGSAIPASPGVATGAAMFDVAAARNAADAGKSVILVRDSASTADIGGLEVAAGLLTATGGRTAHAAVVARQMGKVCLLGCESLVIEPTGHACTIGGKRIKEGTVISLDGNTGRIIAGAVDVERETPVEELAAVRRWAKAAVRGKKAR